jgi:hypothetical protein
VGGWCSKAVTWPYGTSLWKHIRRGCGTFSSFVTIAVGDGFQTSFWHDTWCGDHPIKKSFWSVFALQGIGMLWWLITCLLTMTRCIGMWALSNWCMIGRWILHLPLSMLYILLGVSEMKINVVGFPSKRQSFEVRTFYKVFLSNVDYSFPWKSFWRSKATLRVAFFTWTSSLEIFLQWIIFASCTS